jgi:hypothetical protein
MVQASLALEAVEKLDHVSPRNLTYWPIAELRDDVAAHATLDLAPRPQALDALEIGNSDFR